MSKLHITLATIFLIPFLSSCSSEVCKTCDCTVTESRTTTEQDGTSTTETNTHSKSFTACDSDVNNPNTASWEYYEANPTEISEFTETTGSPFGNQEQVDVKLEENYNCSCEE